MISLSAIATVRNDKKTIKDDNWGGVISTLSLLDPLTAEALEGIETFSHVEVIYFFSPGG